MVEVDVDDGLAVSLGAAAAPEGGPSHVIDAHRVAIGRRRGSEGYREAVVDVYLDHVADVMASVP